MIRCYLRSQHDLTRRSILRQDKIDQMHETLQWTLRRIWMPSEMLAEHGQLFPDLVAAVPHKAHLAKGTALRLERYCVLRSRRAR